MITIDTSQLFLTKAATELEITALSHNHSSLLIKDFY